MPYSKTVLSVGKWKICIHAEDHPPPHTHIKCRKGDAEVVIELNSLEVKHRQNVKDAQVKRLREFVGEYRDELQEQWNELNGVTHEEA